MRIFVAAALLAACGACASDGESGRGATSVSEGKQFAGKATRVEGIARNAKISAAVEGETLVYCLDRPSWPKDLLGKRVAVTGVVEESHDFEAKRGPNGEISQGTEGAVHVMRKSEVEAVK